MKKAYLTKVVVQSFWVVVDDETGMASEQSDPNPVALTPEQWANFHESWLKDWEQLQESLNPETVEEENSTPPMNRAQRRSKK